MVFARVGEATNPGPFTIGAANPTGALGKAHLFQDFAGAEGPRIWGLSETHLTEPGLQKFQVELRQKKTKWKFVPGRAAPPLSTAIGTIGGKATGVGILTDQPARPLAGSWPKEDWSTSRLQACAIQVQQNWIKAGIFYGFAKDAHTKATQDRSDALLANLTDRIVFAARGYRVIMGDFNQTTKDLPQFEIWRQHGFREVQELACHKWNQEIVPTCKRKSVKDHIWISPELIDILMEVQVDDTFFADHAVLAAKFSDLKPHKPVPIWRKPKEIPWNDLRIEEESLSTQVTSYQQVFAELENTAHRALQKAGSIGLIQPQRGRGKTNAPVLARAPVTPVRPSRPHETPVQFLGENFQFTKWCRQLRRLQSYVALTKNDRDTPSVQQHKFKLWLAIKAAPGFPRGFPHAWENRAAKIAGAPSKLPVQPPVHEIANSIFLNFRAEFQALEKLLIGQRRQAATARRLANPQAIFQDVSKSRAQPVQTVVTKTSVVVTEVQQEGLCISYEPQSLDCQQEVTTEHEELITLTHEPGQITLQKHANVEVGDQLFQQKVVGDTTELFDAFKQLWGPIWNQHNGTEPEWEIFARQISTTPGASQEMEMPPITAEQWRHAVRGKKPHTATGPDGISRADLLHMPDHLLSPLLEYINLFDKGILNWEDSALNGHIANVEKSPEASAPKDYRPITVLTMPYRVWATIRARQILRWLIQFVPEGLKGNIPGRSTVDIWWSMALQIEQATHDKSNLCGVVTDITKAYNNLARPIVYACALHFGLPKMFVRAWHNSLANVKRHFIVQGACSGPVWSTSGYPEGDPLSVVAMVLVNLAMHHFVQCQVPTAQISTFVDNWEALATSPEASCRAYAAMEEFANLVQLKLDKAKTHFWAVQPADRKFLRQQNQTVLLHTKDLGAQMNYTRRFTNQASRVRIAKTQAFWGQLFRSPAPVEQKMRAIQAVAWPRCLHGIAIIALASEHFQRLRAQAMASMRWTKKGASATLQFGLLHPKADPGFVALSDTVFTFRNFCNPEIAFPLLTGITTKPPRHFDPGPCAVLLARLHEIQWQWEGHGWLIDHEGIPIHLLHAPLQLLKQRLQHGWERQVGYVMQERKDFAGLGKVDAELSRSSAANTGEERGILRSVMNGTFFTRDKQIHTGKIPSKECPFCHQEDSLQHRIWECEFFQDIRAQVPHASRDFCRQQPDCTRYHGWFVEDCSFVALRKALHEVPSKVVHHVPHQLPDVLQLFVDGGCLNPTKPRLRVAGWAVCVAMLPTDDFMPVASGVVPGLLQTPLRAEIIAAIEAIRFALLTHRPFFMWTDNKHVFNRVSHFLQGAIPPTRKTNNHDLWQTLHALVGQAREQGLIQQVVKVVSHVDITQTAGVIDKWVIRGNHFADKLVNDVLAQLPFQLQIALKQATQQWAIYSQACLDFHRFLVQMGLRAISYKQEIRVQDDDRWQAEPPQPSETDTHQVSLHPFPTTLQLPAEHSFGECAPVLFDWLTKLVTGGRKTPVWISSYQLLIHFQGATGEIGFRYDRPKKTWEMGTDFALVQGYDFNRFAAWMVAALKAFGKALDLAVNVQPRLPWGTTFRSWQRCVLLPVDVEAFSAIDVLLRNQGISAVKKITAFQHLQPFNKDFR